MSNVVQSSKTKRRPVGPLILILFIILITLTAVLVNTALRRNLDRSEETIHSLLLLQGQAYRLSALEWQAISAGGVTIEVAEAVESTRQEMLGTLEELKEVEPEKIQPVGEAFTAYEAAITEEFELISAGNIEEARKIDEEKVDPAFENLAEVLTSTHALYEADTIQTKQRSDLGFNLLLFFIAAAMALAFWQFQRTQASAEREHLDELKIVNLELESNQKSLEQRIVDRTADLEQRAAQMETVSSVARSITAVQDLEQLLPSICQAVSEQFGFYHTGIFLLDERGEFAVLQAANSEGGQYMLKRGHRLRVGATGIVGTVAGHGKARIALNVGADAAYFNNPDLPDTRSEMALPLMIGSQTVGVLDVQSREVGAFKDEDIAVLGILANQISIAIENARLFSQTRQALAESQTTYDQYVKQDWARFARSVKHKGYSYDGIKTVPLENASPLPPVHALTVPIKIRGLIVGNVTVQSNDPLRAWSQDEMNLAQAAAERAGLAIENFRLLTEAQRRAAKERTVGEITARISASVDVRAIMQTAVEELGRTLPGAEVILQFQKND